MNIIFFSDAGNAIFKCIFREKAILLFWQESNFMFVGKRNTIFTEYTEDIIFPFIFWERPSFHFPPRKRNAIFPDDTRKIIFQCDFFGKTIFSEHLKKISYFHVVFWERSSFIFRLKNKIIFSGKRNIIFPDDTRNIIFQWGCFGKTIFSEHLEKENMAFRAVVSPFIVTYLKYVNHV